MKEYHLLDNLINKIKLNFDYSKSYNVGTIITDKKGNILSFGINSYSKTHPKQLHYNKICNPTRIYLHSEIDALIKCKSENAHTMIIARITKKGETKIAKPCEGCFNALRDNGIKKVYYTNNYGELVLLDFDSYHKFLEVCE